MLKPYQLTYWQLSSSRLIDFYWLPAFNLVVNEGDFFLPSRASRVSNLAIWDLIGHFIDLFIVIAQSENW